jgi:transcriptional regulator with XRE-family HTH domain
MGRIDLRQSASNNFLVKSNMITGLQIKAARALLQWERTDLAEKSGVSFSTIRRFEQLGGPISGNVATEAALRKAIEDAGVIFLDGGGAGPGVRLSSV